MLKLTTSEIVRRARQLADLENSNFISWNENINLINESFQKVYQKAINRGEQFFIKEMIIPSEHGNAGNPYSVKLPSDFYQLSSLIDRNDGRPIVRRTVNDANAQLCYEIKNGYLIVYGYFNNPLTLSYYPVPKTLYYPAPSELVMVPDELKTIERRLSDCYENYIVWLEDDKFFIYDTSNAKKQEIEFAYESNFLIAGKNGILFGNSETEDFHCYDYEGNDCGYSHTKVIFIGDDKGIYVESEGGLYDLITEDYITEIPVEVMEKIDSSSGYNIGAFALLKGFSDEYYEETIKAFALCFYGSNEVTIIKENYPSYTVNLTTSPKVIMFNGEVIISNGTDGSILRTDEKSRTIGRNCIGINGINKNTGFGFTTLNGMKNSIFKDSEIEVPNNVFIQMISYSMAITYKAKQNAPIDALSALYAEAETQFFDSLPQDDYQPLRIQNIY